ncbi:P-loop containing nucleoside triphosphate hydrolase protein [Biscogniauxia mediterranea]|nr:P-loop containing nucleoside triphosphate hydrolase protein [Biscogniauxia mediterranea]
MPRLFSGWVTLVSPLQRSLSFAVRPSWRVFPKPIATYATTAAAAAATTPVSSPGKLQQIRLRDYQEECIQSVLASIRNGSKRLGISLATGSGKTVIFTQLIDRITPSSRFANQTLILAHRRELVEQAARHCSHAYPHKSVEIEMGSLHASGTADITVASIQSITSGDRIAKFDPARFKLVLVDEAHHIVAPGYLRTLEHFGLDTKQPDSPSLVGVSATFSRFDGLRLGTAIDEIVYHKDYVDMIGEKWLSDVIFTTVESHANISNVKNGANGDFQQGELSKAVNTEETNEITVRSWLAKAGQRKSTLVFCVDLAHVSGLTQTFRQHGIDARFITGDTPKVERGERLEAFRAGEFPVLVNCGVFTEGTDIPNIDCVILARPTRSRNLLVQMIGRGMRLHPGKTNCHVIDMVSSLSTGIVTTPTLFGLDPSEIVKEATVTSLQDLKARKEAEEERAKEVIATTQGPTKTNLNYRVTFSEYETVLDLIADTSGERHIRAISNYAWVQVGPNKYVLSGVDGSYIKLEKKDDPEDGTSVYEAWETHALSSALSKSSRRPFAKPRRILTAATFADAVHGSDKFASEKYPHALISRYSKWRDGPPTDGQLTFLNKLRKEGDSKLGPTNITKGHAADMITKIRHGARGRFATIEAKKRRELRKISIKEEQLAALRHREKVSVGPLPV